MAAHNKPSAGPHPQNAPHRSRHIGLLVSGLALVIIGIAGMVMAASFTSRVPVTRISGGKVIGNGERIYYTGADDTGPIPRAIAGGGMMGFGMMGSIGCVDCHGEDGRGGRVGMMFGPIDIPDIRYSALTSAKSEAGTSTPGWTESDIARAIRDGIEPNGAALKAPMPRWAMSEADLRDVIGYLKELDAR